ncbi:DUF456 domain-containing protein [Rhodococcus triatomae]|uniref:DUF456 domain-containing protein n=1 Tax=Rhodococcus triatomae TaxID=300028 RepID=A0A1G8NRT1_9NOCA|nr:DUF456 domain-containing protein [Rhodococcus triatomae]QNG20073.1 DUF456 domain-containing protein [Rhodococcus triatomae]QNG24011.1 DUF456 domain-containing protein [Rhodococcus triatomae]SDI82878.1 hypothetical protein SAMN05444695_111153 [Rhodococcus triatomae]
MSGAAELVVGLVILVGLIGIVVPVLPGVILIFGAITVWAVFTGGTAAWVAFGIATAVLVATGVVKYTWPGRRMQVAGVPNRSIVVGGLTGLVGFFVVPVVGLFAGFVAGTYAAEWCRLRRPGLAWTSSWHATKAVGLSILVELFGGLVATAVWLTALTQT